MAICYQNCNENSIYVPESEELQNAFQMAEIVCHLDTISQRYRINTWIKLDQMSCSIFIGYVSAKIHSVFSQSRGFPRLPETQKIIDFGLVFVDLQQFRSSCTSNYRYKKCAYKLICYEIEHGQVALLVERLCSHLKVTGSTPGSVSILLILISIAKNAIR